jgi:Fe-S-cluster containining protein
MQDSLDPYFNLYLEVVKEADAAFVRVSQEYGDLVKCRPGCNDCCYAVFKMEPVEAAYLSCMFYQLLPRKERREILKKADKALARLAGIESRLRNSEAVDFADPFLVLSRERVECPLLAQGKCALYPHRPITCRIYGIPTSIRGKGAVCGKSGFSPGESYPTVNMDLVDRRLYEISRIMAAEAVGLILNQGVLLFSVAAAVLQPLDRHYFTNLKKRT